MQDIYSNYGFSKSGYHTHINEYGRHCKPTFGYMISVNRRNFEVNGPNQENTKVTLYRRVASKDQKHYNSLFAVDLNSIDSKLFNHFVFIDSGSVSCFEATACASDLSQNSAQSLGEQDIFNVSNELKPLKVYRLKRTMGFLKKPNEKHDEIITKTYWTVENLDHSKNVPCSRKNHCIVVNNAKNCLYLFGGITILVDAKFKDCPDKMRNKQFQQKKQLCDVWKLCLTTNTWEKIMDFRPESQTTSKKTLTSPFLFFNLYAFYDEKRDLIYGCYQEHTLENNTKVVKTLNIICIDPISKRFEEYSYPVEAEATLSLNNSREILYVHPYQNDTKAFLLIDEKKLNAKTRQTMQLLTPCDRATIIYGPPKNSTTRARCASRWKSIIGKITHGKLL